jgi:hypothetical protein
MTFWQERIKREFDVANFNIVNFNDAFEKKTRSTPRDPTVAMEALYRKQGIDPDQDSPTRVVILLLVNKFDKRFVGATGRTKMVEPFKSAAVRVFWEQTSMVVKEENIYKLAHVHTRTRLDIVTFIAFRFEPTVLKWPVSWQPLRGLYMHNDERRFEEFYKYLYKRVLSIIY